MKFKTFVLRQWVIYPIIALRFMVISPEAKEVIDLIFCLLMIGAIPEILKTKASLTKGERIYNYVLLALAIIGASLITYSTFISPRLH